MSTEAKEGVLRIGLSVFFMVFAALSSYANAGDLQDRVTVLEEEVDKLQRQLKKLLDLTKAQNITITQLSVAMNAQNDLIVSLQQQSQTVQSTLGCMSKTGDDVYFTGCNVHVRSGAGATDGAVNGLGNLIVGYNEDASGFEGTDGPSVRKGSHNLVVGPAHSYSSYGGLVAGWGNWVLGPHTTVSGGQSNIAGSGDSLSGFAAYSSISGGANNRATRRNASVSGGSGNTAAGGVSSVCGGVGNTAIGNFSTVSGDAITLRMVITAVLAVGRITTLTVTEAASVVAATIRRPDSGQA